MPDKIADSPASRAIRRVADAPTETGSVEQQ